MHYVSIEIKQYKIYQIDNIVALDPAGPIFDWHSREYRLDKNDAKVVHVFHTSESTVEIEDPLGHADFYVNGMWGNQPLTNSCPNSKNVDCGCPKNFILCIVTNCNEGKLNLSKMLLLLCRG